jgi:hypothetical protein
MAWRGRPEIPPERVQLLIIGRVAEFFHGIISCSIECSGRRPWRVAVTKSAWVRTIWLPEDILLSSHVTLSIDLDSWKLTGAIMSAWPQQIVTLGSGAPNPRVETPGLPTDWVPVLELTSGSTPATC